MDSGPAATADYRPRIVDGAVIGGRCEVCGYTMAPATPRCPACGGEVLPGIRFAAVGRVWAATVIHVPVGDSQPPYGLAYVDLADGPRLLCHTSRPVQLEAGAEVTLTEANDDLVTHHAGWPR